MRPHDIGIISFEFVGGEAEGCLYIEDTPEVQDTIALLNKAKCMITEFGAYYATTVLYSKHGGKEVLKLYSYQELNKNSVPVERWFL